CFNGLDYDQPVSSLNCPCTRHDYECHFAFHLNTSTNKCDAGDTHNLVGLTTVPMSCTKGEFYNRTKGYRKVPGDTCVGGEDYKFEAELTPCPLEEEKEFLLVSNRNSILRYDMLNPQEGLKKLPLQNLEAVIALDFHLKNNCLYWSDALTKKIMRQCFDGNHQQETLVESGIESAEGLALDWVSQLLYMVDGVNMKVEVMRIDAPFNSRMRKTIIQKPDVGLPRGIALHPVRGYLFLTDWSETTPKVARAHLDGTDLQILFGKGQVGWPNGITIDFQTERIFWADAKFDYIASSDLDGKGFRKVISDSENVRQPFAVGIYKSLLYWDDWNSFKIFRADKENGWNVTPLSDEPIIGLVDLKVFGHWSQTGSNACGEGSEPKCQFFCTGTPNNDYTCLCPEWLERVEDGEHHKCVCKDGSSPNVMGACKTSEDMTATNTFKCKNGYFIPVTMLCDMDNDCGDFSDEENCRLDSSCDGASLQCKNGHCISPAWKCDSDNDCGDNSDEEGCEYKACTEDQFTCKNKRCIDKKWVCDLQDDCRDGSDEANCTKPIPEYGLCRSTQFMCNSSHTCLPISWRCDNEFDCGDGSDENDCETHKCNLFQFQCSSNKCIYKSWLCDGDKDCPDGKDEENCDSSTGTTTSTVSPFLPPAKNATCSSFEFRCVNGNCVPFWWRCDLAFDCLDGS
ncbi:UNVERIFIED_CONTAM: hypothetical protein GTU68_028010, partial [Idotea baltica]|nr:hypothetical protein [Idotea baltica]